MASPAAIASASPERPRSLRALMAARDIWTYRDLSKISGVDEARISQVVQGWKPWPIVLKRLSKALGVTEADIIAAASLAHQGGAK